MACEAYKTSFKKYMEGILEEQALEDFHQHIKTCSQCRAGLREFSHMQDILSDSMNPSDAGRQKISQAVTNLSVHTQKHIAARKVTISFLRYGAAAAVFLIAGLYFGSRQSQNPILQQEPLNIAVSELQGDVLVKHPWEDGWKEMTLDDSIYKGDTFRSLHQASLILSLGTNNTVSLNENSSLELLEHNGQTEFDITYGTVKATLAGPHEPFFISTPQGRFEALGTEFIVRVR